MKVKREAKIGIFAVTMILAAWAGIRFLSGIDIFSRNVEYYAAYDQINGVQAASPIMMRGVKIGTVTGIAFDPAKSDKVMLQLTIRRTYRIPTDSEAKIVSQSLMGGKAIEVSYGAASTYLEAGDTIRSSRDRDLMDMADSELDFFKQRFSRLTDDLSQTLGNINRLLEENAASLSGTMAHLNSITGNVDELLAAERTHLHEAIGGLSEFAGTLGENAGRVDSILRSVNAMAGELSEQEFASNLAGSVEELNALLEKLNEQQGTLGKLVGDAALYDSLTEASGNLATLLEDLKQYPARYVHLSLFGRDPEKMKARAERRAAKEAARAERDSLKRAAQQ